MIQRVRLCNFKSLGDVSVDLKPITVLIGRSGTGKTNFVVNTLLRHLIAQQGQGVRGPIVPLSEDTVTLSLEPTNAEIIRERALNQRAARTRDAARTLLQQFDKGVWEERYKAFQLLVQQALHEKRD